MSARFILLFLVVCIFFACRNTTMTRQENIKKVTLIQEQMQSEGWVFKVLKGGNLNENMGVKPIYGIQDNYFDITIGGGYDVVLKIMNASTNQCIRYVYVPNNEAITINEIPQGHYYLKFAYGQDWMELATDSIVYGKFTRAVFFERSTSFFDFGRKNTQDFINYSLELNVMNGTTENSFQTQMISEVEFEKN